jgi:hypothetical protein
VHTAGGPDENMGFEERVITVWISTQGKVFGSSKSDLLQNYK